MVAPVFSSKSKRGSSERFWPMALLLLTLGCSVQDKPMGKGTCDKGDVCRDCDCDTICDLHEGASPEANCTDGDGVDTDEDTIPDYLDPDSDNDGVPDSEEAGDSDRSTPPDLYDHDADGTPDFRDPGYPPRPRPDAGGQGFLDGGGVYQQEDDAGADASSCQPEPSECLPADIDEASAELCDGLDNDCDGTVDEGCPCQAAGAVQACFQGPPGWRNRGACLDGRQVCESVEEFSLRWGPCLDGISPAAEVCDGSDNDCDGCTDEIAGCVPYGTCPGADDNRVVGGRPFTSYPLDGELFYPGADAVGWRWTVQGSPCDRLFQAIDEQAGPESGRLSYRLRGATSRNAVVDFSLSGSYLVGLTVEKEDGSSFDCSWMVKVGAAGLRVELCWDRTGPAATLSEQGVDLDLHLAKKTETSALFSETDCYWRTCRGADTPWTYENTNDLESCTGELADNYQAYAYLGNCPNPRLDIDNRELSGDRYLAENINLDNPKGGHSFRIMVDYYTNLRVEQAGGTPGPETAIETHPLVNVYCNGDLRGSYGALPGESNQVEGFDNPGQMWRVADVFISRGGSRIACELTPIEPDQPPGALHTIGPRETDF